MRLLATPRATSAATPDLRAARSAFAAYSQVAAGLIAFDFVELIGMPAVAAVHERRGEPMPNWWPA